MHDDKTQMVVTKSIAQFNININLVISRRVNANASPDVPKPLYQWGGCASFPLIQRFSDVRRGVSINTSANLQVDVDVELCYPLEHKYFILLKLNSKHNL